MDTADKMLLAVMALSLFGSALTRAAAYMRERHDSALARVIGFAGRVAGEASVALRNAPAGTDPGIVTESAIAAGVKEAKREFGPSLSIIGGDDEKLLAMIRRELGKLQAGQAAVPAALAAVAAPALEGVR